MKKLLLILLPVLLLAGWITYILWPRYPDGLEGIYLVDGGFSYLEIQKDTIGGVSIKPGLTQPSRPGEKVVPVVFTHDDFRRIDYLGMGNQQGAMEKLFSEPRQSKDHTLGFFDIRSSTADGDWGLIRAVGGSLMDKSLLHKPVVSFLNRFDDSAIPLHFENGELPDTARQLLDRYPDDLYI
jgi:hypothetical protein